MGIKGKHNSSQIYLTDHTEGEIISVGYNLYFTNSFQTDYYRKKAKNEKKRVMRCQGIDIALIINFKQQKKCENLNDNDSNTLTVVFHACRNCRYKRSQPLSFRKNYI